MTEGLFFFFFPFFNGTNVASTCRLPKGVPLFGEGVGSKRTETGTVTSSISLFMSPDQWHPNHTEKITHCISLPKPNKYYCPWELSQDDQSNTGVYN